MIDLKLNKESELSFELNIEGNKSTPKARLIFEIDNQMELAIIGKISENSVKITVPSLMDLKEKLSGENVKGYLEVIVDESYFVPWDELFSLTAPITVQAESTKIVNNKAPEIKISVKSSNKPREKVKLLKDFRIPGTNILLEANDTFEVLYESDAGFNEAIVIREGFTIPDTETIISKHSRIKILN